MAEKLNERGHKWNRSNRRGDAIGQGPPDNERINEDIGSDRISQEPLSLSIYIYLSIYIKIGRANLVISLIVGLWVYTNGSTV